MRECNNIFYCESYKTKLLSKQDHDIFMMNQFNKKKSIDETLHLYYEINEQNKTTLIYNDHNPFIMLQGTHKLEEDLITLS